MNKQGRPKRMAARVESWASAWRAVMDNSDSEITQLRFRVAENSADLIKDASWAHFWPALAGSVRDERKRRIGITLVDRAQLRALGTAHFVEHANTRKQQLLDGVELPKEKHCSRAIAYELGGLVMVAEIPGHVVMPKNDNNYFFAMTVEDEGLRTTAGLWHPDSRELFVPPEGVHAGRTIDVASGDTQIPIFK